jgi:hypothetical protein
LASEGFKLRGRREGGGRGAERDDDEDVEGEMARGGG